MLFRILFALLLACPLSLLAQNGQWVRQTTFPPSVPNLWGVAMFNDEEGLAAGGISVSPNPGAMSGILKKSNGDPVWRVVDTANFTPSLSTLGGVTFWSAVCVVPGTGIGFVSGDRAQVYKTSDGGTTWTQKTVGITGTQSFFDIKFKNSNEGVVVGNNGIAFYTANGGDTWTPISTGTANGLYGVHEGSGNDWYLVGNAMTAVRWTAPAGPASVVTIPPITGTPRLEGIHWPTSTVGFIVGGNGGVARTTNSGTNWTLLPPVTPSPTLLNCVFAFDDQSFWAAGNANALYYTSNAGAAWNTHASVGGASGAVTRIHFPVNQNTGYASGPASSSAMGWILKWQPSTSPDISATPNTLDFGIQDCGLSHTATLSVSNTGTGDLTITAGQVTFSNPNFTLLSPTLPLTLTPGDSRDFVVRWSPPVGFTGPIPAGTVMNIASNDVVHTPWVVTLTGTRNRSGISLVTSSIAFSDACTGVAVDQPFSINKTGNQPATLVDVQFVSGHNDVTLLTPPLGTVLTGPTDLQLRFTPGTRGPRSGVYRIIAGNPSCPDTVLMNFNGRGLKTHMTPSPVVTDFGEVCVGAIKKLTLDLTNDGDTPASMAAYEFLDGVDAFPQIQNVPYGPFAVGITTKLNVQFSPQVGQDGIVQGRYRLIMSPCSDTVIITLTGKAVTPSLTATPNPIVFSNISVGGQGLASVSVINTGTTPVNITSIKFMPTAPGLSIQGMPSLPQSVDPGKPISFNVRYSPLKVETFATQVCIYINQPCVDSLCIPITASSEPAPTIVAPPSLDLGLQACPDSIRKSFMVYNTGDGPLVISRFEVTGTDFGNFSVVSPTPPATIAAKDSVEVIVEFKRPVGGTAAAVLTIFHNDTKVSGRTQVTLTGRRTVASLSVRDKDSSIAFVTCVKTGFAKTFEIRNTGTEPITITAISAVTGAQAFSVGGIPLPTPLAVGSAITFQVNFTPPTGGVFSGEIRVQAQPCNLETILSVTGTTVSTRLRITPNPVDMGAVILGDSATVPVMIENIGSVPVTISSLFLNPSGAVLHFSPTPSVPLSIPAGDSRLVNVVFRPTVTGPLSGTICAVTTAPCPDTLCIPVVGLGTSLGISFNRSQLNFTIDPCDPRALCDTVTVVNNGGVPVTITNWSIDQVTLNLFSMNPALSTPAVIAAKSSRTLVLCVDPTFSGTFTGTLVLLTDDPTTPRLELPLRAQRDVVDITLLEDTLAFGGLTKCESFKELEFSIRNAGALQEIVSLLTPIGSPFSIVTPLPISVEPSQTQRLRVRFSPSVSGIFADSVVLKTSRCNTVLRLVLTGLRSDRNYDVTEDTLIYTPITVGSSQSRITEVENLTLDSLRVARTAFGGSGQFRLATPLPATVRRGERYPVTVIYEPTTKGSVRDTLFLIFDEPCGDTLRVLLIASALDGGLEFRPTGLQFPALAQCESIILNDTLVNTGSSSISLIGSSITGTDAGSFTILNPVNRIDLAGSGGTYVFQVRFAPGPGLDGPLSASLVVATNDPTQPTVEAPLTGTRRTQTTPVDQVVNFGSITRGVTESRTVLLTNPGAVPITYTSSTLPTGVSILPAVPFTISAGGQQTVTVNWTPPSSGVQQVTILLDVSSPCIDTTRIDLRATVVDGPWMTSAQLGPISTCESRTITLRIHNAQSLIASLEQLRTSGGDSTAFTIDAPSTFPLTIAAQDSLDLTITFRPASGASKVYATTVIARLLVNGVPLTIQGTVTAEVTAMDLRIVGATPDFGNVQVGGTKQMPVSFRNPLGYPIRIASISFTHGDFSLLSALPSIPGPLDPAQVLLLSVQLAPGQPGNYTDSIIVVTDQPCHSRFAFPVTGRGIEVHTASAQLSIPDLTGRIDDIVVIPVIVTGDVGSANVTSWEGSLQFNRTMLYPLRVLTQGSLSSGMTVTHNYQQTDGILRLQASGAAVGQGSGSLILIEALVLLGNDTRTPIRMDTTFRFTSGTARVESRRDGSFELMGYCADEGARLVRTDGNFALRQNHPNPFNPSTVIEYAIGFATHVDLRLYDAMGREVAVLVNGPQEAGHHRLVFEAGGLPSGAYLYRLRSACYSEDRIMLLAK